MNIAILLMAGKGRRTGFGVPKQYISTGERPLFKYSLMTLYNCKEIDRIIMVVNREHYEAMIGEVYDSNLHDKVEVCVGGMDRKDSVLAGMLRLEKKVSPEDTILVHDAARPFVSEKIIRENILESEKEGIVVTAISATDTIIELDEKEKVNKYLNRKLIKEVQTPQTFKYKHFLKVKDKYRVSGDETDDSMVFFNASLPVHFVEGNILNFKVTTSADFTIFELLASKLYSR